MNTARGGHPVGRIAAALPDAFSCAVFLLVWIGPLTLGAVWVKNLMITMLLEFLTVHSGGFIGTTLASDSATRATKSKVVVGFGAFYLLFAGAFSLAFEAWWPVAVFAWLLLAKFALVWLAPLPGPAERQRQGYLVGASVVGYIGGVFLTLFLPLPELGIDASVREAAAIPGSGAWVDEPHRVVAFGALYFGFMAWAKWHWQPGNPVPAARRRQP